MESQQKAVIVVAHLAADAADAESNVADLNQLLQRGWRVVQSSAMGAAGGGEAVSFASLVILERSDRKQAATLAEEADEALDALLEGDGAGVEVTPEVPPGDLEVEPGRERDDPSQGRTSRLW